MVGVGELKGIGVGVGEDEITAIRVGEGVIADEGIGVPLRLPEEALTVTVWVHEVEAKLSPPLLSVNVAVAL